MNRYAILRVLVCVCVFVYVCFIVWFGFRLFNFMGGWKFVELYGETTRPMWVHRVSRWCVFIAALRSCVTLSLSSHTPQLALPVSFFCLFVRSPVRLFPRVGHVGIAPRHQSLRVVAEKLVVKPRAELLCKINDRRLIHALYARCQ